MGKSNYSYFDYLYLVQSIAPFTFVFFFFKAVGRGNPHLKFIKDTIWLTKTVNINLAALAFKHCIRIPSWLTKMLLQTVNITVLCRKF